MAQLPAEVWNHVLGHLSASDKLSVRASCRYFKKMVDHSSLWRNWTVVLGFKNGSYTRKFWATLRRRKVSSAVVRSSKAKDWKVVAQAVPGLSTVVMDQSSQKTLDCLKDFPSLKRVAIRSSCTKLFLDTFIMSQPQQLTHLSLCDVLLHVPSMESLISGISQFTNLTSLVWHKVGIFEETFIMICTLLTCLPKLQHLSLSIADRHCAYHSVARSNPVPQGGASGTPTLTSLELINCMDHSLPDDVMRMMPGLESLAIFYKHSHQELLETGPSPGYHLEKWLSDLPELSTLVIVNGPPVKTYVTTIPATVTSLTLCVPGLSSVEMGAVGAQVPNLLHLHIDSWPSHLGHHTAQIPQLFPKLRSLKLRHEHVPEEDFLCLHQLQDLQYLEVLDSQPQLSVLTGKLQVLTNYRLCVKTFPRQRDVFSCPCVCQVY